MRLLGQVVRPVPGASRAAEVVVRRSGCSPGLLLLARLALT
jgi:hypothetical protein